MLYPNIFINGEIRHRDQALIPVYDLGLLRGFGIFDFFRVWDGIPVFAEDQLHSVNAVACEYDLQQIQVFHPIPGKNQRWLSCVANLNHTHGSAHDRGGGSLRL